MYLHHGQCVQEMEERKREQAGELRRERNRVMQVTACQVDQTYSPDVHESNTSDVRRVLVVQHGSQLLPSQLEGEEFEEEAIRCGYYTPCSHSPNLQIPCAKIEKQH